MIRRWLSMIFFAGALVMSQVASSQCVSLTTPGAAYNQNFDTLSNTAGSTTNNLTITGWFLTESGGSLRDNEQYAVDTGASNTGDTYSYGAPGSTDRALGGLRSGTLIPTFGACFTNNTGVTINSLQIAYIGEQWRSGTAGRTDQIIFEYSTNATDLSTGSWSGVPALNFVTPNTVGTGAKDGNASGNRTSLSSSIPSLSIANGATFWVRWIDTDASGADDGLAVDDFSLTPNAGAALPNLTINDVSLNESNSGTTAFNFTVSLSAPAGPGGVTFDIATADGTATLANNDYVAQSLTGQTIPAGSSTYTFTVTVNGDTTPEPNETFFVNITNVSGATVVDGQGQGTIVNDDVVVARIHDVQGSGAATPIPGAVVTVEGIVIGRYQGANQLQGFFLQEEDADADADPNTSEGIFVFCNTCPTAVAEGQRVRVTGSVSEFNNMTQITASTAGSVVVTDTGNNLALVTPTIITLPIVGNIDAFYERLEGMRVTFANTLSVAELFELPRYGQIVLYQGGRPMQFTEENAPSAAGLIAHEDALARRRVILDDDNNTQNAYLNQAAGLQAIYHPRANGGFSVGTQGTDFFRAGDTVSSLTGVLHWSFPGFGADTWRIRPTQANPVSFTAVNTRPAAAPTVGGAIKAASVNMLNYFTTIDTTSSSSSGPCAPDGLQDCRGADSVAELSRQRERASIVLCGLNADVTALMEMENTTPSATITDLLGAVNARCGGSTPYAFVNTGGTLGTDAIRVNLIYRTGVLAPVGSAMVDLDPIHSRAPTAQTFDVVAATNPAFGQRFTVIANHLKSKGCGGASGADLDQLDGQGCFNDRRTQQASRMLAWINSTVIPSAGDPDVLMLGDFNSYARETPITTLTSGGYTDLASSLLGAGTYSYLFNGQLGHLDYALSSGSLTPQVKGIGIWHINADESDLFDYSDEIRDTGEASFEEKPDGSALTPPRVVFQAGSPFRASDHDPVLVGLFGVADVSITKTDSPDPVLAGNNLVYTITASNAGPDAAGNVTMSDSLPAGTTFVSLVAPAGWSCTTPAVGASGTVSCNAASLGLSSAVFTLTVNVGSAVASASVISNTATISTTTGDPNSSNNSATSTTSVSTSADLSATIVDSPDPVVAGNNISYAITVANNGPSNAANASWSDTLPAGTTFVSLTSPAGWSCTTPAVGAAGTINCNIASLSPSSVGFTLVAAVSGSTSAGTLLSNTVSASSSTSDPTSGNNNATTTTTVAAAAMTPTWLAVPTTVAPGQTFTGLRLECRNSGTSAANAPTCVPTANVGSVSAVVCSPSAPATLAAGAAITCDFNYAAPGTSGGADEPASAVVFTGSSGASNVNGGTPSVATANAVVIDAINDTPTAISNSSAQVVSVIGNDGLGAGIATSATVVASSNGVATCSGCNGTPTALTVAANGEISVPALAVAGTYQVPYRICAAVANNSPIEAACDSAVATLVIQGADMVSSLVCNPLSPAAGSPVTCTATCTNNGPAAAINATCAILNAASLPGAPTPSCTGSPAASLASGASLSCVVSFTMPSERTVAVNAGASAANDPSGSDPAAAGNASSVVLAAAAAAAIPTLPGWGGVLAFALMLLATGARKLRRT